MEIQPQSRSSPTLQPGRQGRLSTWVWTQIHEFCERHQIQRVVIKGDEAEARLVKKWMRISLDVSIQPRYPIQATGEATPIVAISRRIPETLRHFMEAVRSLRPRHRHYSAKRGDKPAPEDYLHCSAVEVLYFVIYYTPGDKSGTELPEFTLSSLQK